VCKKNLSERIYKELNTFQTMVFMMKRDRKEKVSLLSHSQHGLSEIK